MHFAIIIRRIAAFLLTLAGLFFGGCVFTAIANIGSFREIIFGMISIFIFGALSSVSFYFAQRFRSRLADAVLAEDRRAPILYLRSFGADQGYRGGGWLRLGRAENDEEALTRLLRKLGPVVAVGKPGEFLPLPGAARMYMDQQNWHGGVTELLRKSALLVLRVGATDGLLWEVDAACRIVHPARLVIWLPPYGWLPKRRRNRELIYRIFRARVGSTSLLSLPDEFPRSSEFLYFKDDWTPCFSRGTPSFYARVRGVTALSRLPRLRAQLREILRNAGLALPGIPWRPAEFVNIYLFMFALIGAAALAAVSIISQLPLKVVPAEFDRSVIASNAWSPIRASKQDGVPLLRIESNSRLPGGVLSQLLAVCDLSKGAAAMRIALYSVDGRPVELMRTKRNDPTNFDLVIDGKSRTETSQTDKDFVVYLNAIEMVLLFRAQKRMVITPDIQRRHGFAAALVRRAAQAQIDSEKALAQRTNRLTSSRSVELKLQTSNGQTHVIDLHALDENLRVFFERCRGDAGGAAKGKAP